MLTNLIQQLQGEALDDTVRLSTLLRKVKLIASKLGLADTAKWVDAELQGYQQQDEKVYPSYRQVTGQIKAYSHYHGWQTASGDSNIITALSQRKIADSVSSMEDILSRNKGGVLLLPIDPKVKEDLLNSPGNFGWTDMHTEIQRSFLVSILDHVRTLVLNWALELEEQGITGEGLNFSEAEKTTAKAASISIENFSGNLHTGDISGVQNRVSQGATDHSVNIHDASQIFNDVRHAAQALDDELRKKVENLIDEMQETRQTPRFAALYASFAEVAANTTALLPFLPGLSAFLPT